MKPKSQKILLFIADEYEDLELQYPKYRLREAGKKVVVAGEKRESYKGKHGYPCIADVTFKEIKVGDFDALVIPGGYAPDKLRKISRVLEITKEFARQKKLIAFICHAGWIPISAKILKGIQCTSYISIKEDILNAGGKWVNKSVVIDRHFISSRFPEDLPDFCSAILNYLSRG